MSAAGIWMRLARDDAGAAAAEMVLLLPLAGLMLMVTLDAGYFMYTEHEVMKSVRDAARYGARQPFAAFNCTAETAEAELPSDSSTLGQIRTNLANLARYGQLTTTGPLLVPGWTDAQVVVTYSCKASTTGLYAAQQFAPRITVIAKPTYPTLFGGGSGFLASQALFAREQAVVVGI
jgi:Flp pilus assembly protein TadG